MRIVFPARVADISGVMTHSFTPRTMNDNYKGREMESAPRPEPHGQD